MLQETQLDADDPRANYMLQAGARLCKCLGSEFIPYLGVVMPSLLRSAQLKPDVNVADAGSDDEEDDDDDEVEFLFEGCTSNYCHHQQADASQECIKDIFLSAWQQHG